MTRDQSLGSAFERLLSAERRTEPPVQVQLFAESERQTCALRARIHLRIRKSGPKVLPLSSFPLCRLH
jgi:hypothetical protein